MGRDRVTISRRMASMLLENLLGEQAAHYSRSSKPPKLLTDDIAALENVLATTKEQPNE